MNFRIIGIGQQTGRDLDLVSKRNYIDISCEHTESAAEIEVSDSDTMAIILAYDHFDLAATVARKFYQAGVLTLGATSEYIDKPGCFASQTFCNDGARLCTIIEALTYPMVNAGHINLDFNDINNNLKDTGKFTTRFEQAESMDSLMSKLADTLSHLDLSKIETMTLDIYALPSDMKISEAQQITELIETVPSECSIIWGLSQLPGMAPGQRAMSMILAGKELPFGV